MNLIDTSLLDLAGNPCIWAPVLAWTTAQMTKMLCGYFHTRRIDFRYIASTGGMPSAHSAMASAIAAITGLHEGFRSPLFAIALCFAAIVMFDASTVRRSTGLQAKLLNEMIEELFKEHHLSERRLKEFLGHTRLEVLMGMIIGILVAILVGSVFVLAKG
jgi:hypothetical protein